MIEIRRTIDFHRWVEQLDETPKAIIAGRIQRMQGGNFGDHKNLGSKVYAMRIHFGPGYRVYFSKTGNTIVLLLNGGDKKSQAKDIAKAKLMAQEL